MIAPKRVGAWEYAGAVQDRRIRAHTLLHPRAWLSASHAAVTIIFVGAIALRVVPWLANHPLHRDEALYGYWARLIASGQDPLLLTPWIDKPPLVLYLLAASLRAFGVSELALRLPGVIASLLLVLVTFGFARRAYGARSALAVGGLLALSPFAILFAPTAFTDPWLTLWLVAAAWAALAGRPFVAGLLLGLAVASKQQGVLGVPLVLVLLAVQRSGGSERQCRARLRSSALLLLRALLGFALVFGPLTYWDSLRWINRPSFWDRSMATYGPLAVAPLAEWPQRAMAWTPQLRYLFGLPALSALMLLVAAAVGVRAVLALRAARQNGLPDRADDRSARGIGIQRLAVDVILAVYVAGYLALHVAATFQPWDRYLLPILPWLCVLVGRGFVLGAKRLGKAALGNTAENAEIKINLPARPASLPVKSWSVLLLIIPALLYAAWLGAAGRLPVGSDHGAYAGLDQAIAVLRHQPDGAIIYHRWLGWHYDFYLFDAPQERRWWGSGWKLADDAARTARGEPDRPQWLVLPAWEASAAEEVHLPLASRGLTLVEVKRIHRPDGARAFTMYRIIPLAAEVTR